MKYLFFVLTDTYTSPKLQSNFYTKDDMKDIAGFPVLKIKRMCAQSIFLT